MLSQRTIQCWEERYNDRLSKAYHLSEYPIVFFFHSHSLLSKQVKSKSCQKYVILLERQVHCVCMKHCAEITHDTRHIESPSVQC